jgi:hypothetical protein
MLQSVTSKIGQKHRNDKARLKSAFITAINGLQVILQLMKGLPTSVGPPGLHAGITGLLFVLDAIKVRHEIMSQSVSLINDYIANFSKRNRH